MTVANLLIKHDVLDTNRAYYDFTLVRNEEILDIAVG
jgi:hypothetical protein